MQRHQAQPNPGGSGDTPGKALSGTRTQFLDKTFISSLRANSIHQSLMSDPLKTSLRSIENEHLLDRR